MCSRSLRRPGRALVPVLIRFAVLLCGLFLVSLGISCYLTARLGSDPVTIFVQGLSHALSIRFGVAMNLFNALWFGIILLVNWKYIRVGTLANLLLVGVFCDLSNGLFVHIFPSNIGMGMRIFLLCLGTILLGAGLGVYQAGGLGSSPSDAVNLTVSQRLAIPLKWVRIAFDSIMVIGGCLMGEPLRAGTLLGTFAVGPIMSHVLVRTDSRLSRLMEYLSA